MEGKEIKALILNSGIKCWQVASELGITDGNFSRRLRKPFDEKDVLKIKSAITKIKAKIEANEK